MLGRVNLTPRIHHGDSFQLSRWGSPSSHILLIWPSVRQTSITSPLGDGRWGTRVPSWPYLALEGIMLFHARRLCPTGVSEVCPNINLGIVKNMSLLIKPRMNGERNKTLSTAGLNEFVGQHWVVACNKSELQVPSHAQKGKDQLACDND